MALCPQCSLTTEGSGWLRKEPSTTWKKALDQSTHTDSLEATSRRSWSTPFTPPDIRQPSPILNPQAGVPVLHDLEMKNESEDEKLWVAVYDRYGDPEGNIKGNREGLLELKKRIDQALESGEGLCEELVCDFNSVQISEENPIGALEEDTMKDRAMMFGCLGLAVICLAIFIFGLISIWKLLNQS